MSRQTKNDMARKANITRNYIRRIVSESVRRALNESSSSVDTAPLENIYNEFAELVSQADEKLHNPSALRYLQIEQQQMEKVLNAINAAGGDEFLRDTVICGLKSTAFTLDFDLDEVMPASNENEIYDKVPEEEFYDHYEEYEYEKRLQYLSGQFYSELDNCIYDAKAKYKR